MLTNVRTDLQVCPDFLGRPGGAPPRITLSGQLLTVVLPDNGVSPTDAQDTFDAVGRIFRERSLPTEEIVADFTEGHQADDDGPHHGADT